VSQRILRSHWDRLIHPLQRPHWHRWIRFHGLIETAKSASAVSLRPPNLLPLNPKLNLLKHSFVLKTTLLCKNNVVEIFSRILWSHWNRRSRFHGLIEAGKAGSTVSLKPQKWLPRPLPLKQTISNNYLEFLSDFEAICETALAHESGPQGVDWWKNWGSKISWHCPFKGQFLQVTK
jgi:hypothetical protein